MNRRILSIIVLIVVLEVLIGNELNPLQICTSLAVASREDHTVTLIEIQHIGLDHSSLEPNFTANVYHAWPKSRSVRD